MTYSEREAIFAKEALSISDIQILFNITYQHAAQIIRNIKRKYDRLGIQGKIHTEDYFKYFNIKTDRYASEEKY